MANHSIFPTNSLGVTWTSYRSCSGDGTPPSATVSTSTGKISFKGNGDGSNQGFIYHKYIAQVNLSSYKTLTIEYTGASVWAIGEIRLTVTSSVSAGTEGTKESDALSGDGSASIDVSGLSGNYYVGLRCQLNSYSDLEHNPSGSITITDLYLVDNLYKVSYNANGGSGTTSSHSNITPGNSITLRANGFTAPTSKVWTLSGLNVNGGTSIKATFSSNAFYRWRTGATSGTSYQPGATFTPTKNTTLYAWWKTTYNITASRTGYKTSGYLVTYDANGGICPLANDRSNNDVISYEFQGVNTDKSATTGSKTITITADNSTTRYAIWKSVRTPEKITLPTATKKSTTEINTITLNLNGGTLSTPNNSIQSAKVTSYTLEGWYDGSTRVGGAGDKYGALAAKTLTAKYTSSATSYSTVKLPTPSRHGYTFVGWNTNKNATTGNTSYTPTTSGTTTLYAIWKAKPVIKMYYKNNFNNLVEVYMYKDNQWNLVIPFTNNANKQWKKITI